MTATTSSTFNADTEALEVALKFAGAIRGKTILVTGVNQGGIGFTTAEAFVSRDMHSPISRGRPKLTTSIGFSVTRSYHHRRTQPHQSSGKHRLA